MLPKPRPIWQRVLLIACGATLSALNLVSFVRAAGLFPGGFTGLSLLIQECLLRYAGIRVPYSAFSLTLNFLAAALCFRYIGRRFALFSVLAVTITSYSMIFQFCTTQALHTLFQRYQHRTLWIVTDRPDAVYAIIRDATHHGATLFQGTGLYKNEPRSMIYTVLSGDDIRRVVHEVRAVDHHAFINTQRTDSLTGRFYRRPQD